MCVAVCGYVHMSTFPKETSEPTESELLLSARNQLHAPERAASALNC